MSAFAKGDGDTIFNMDYVVQIVKVSGPTQGIELTMVNGATVKVSGAEMDAILKYVSENSATEPVEFVM